MTKALVLLTQEEVCERLRVSRQTVWRYVRDGVLPAVKRKRPGTSRGLLRFREDDVESFARKRS